MAAVTKGGHVDVDDVGYELSSDLNAEVILQMSETVMSSLSAITKQINIRRLRFRC